MNIRMPAERLRQFVPLLLALAALALSPATLAQTTEPYKPHTLAPSLRDQAARVLSTGDKAGARRLYEKWLEADPRDYSSWYNLACLYALTGEQALAIDAFERSVDAGWKDSAHAATDTDLDAIRSDARFTAALARISAKSAVRGPKGFIRHHAPMTSRGSYIVMLPPDYATSTKEYPICVILHGSGSSELAHGRLSDTMGREGVIYIAPRAPYPHADVVATGSMGWTAWPPDDLEETDPNYAQVPLDYVDWVITCIDEVQRTYRARKGRVHIYGHSQGGNLANVVALLHPDRVASYYSQAASLPRKQFLTAEHARRMKEHGVRAYLSHGAEDNVVPSSTSTTIDALLTDAGVEHRLRIVPGDHTVRGALLVDVREWVEMEVRGGR
jgi:phospholipase/carboxylesterase